MHSYELVPSFPVIKLREMDFFAFLVLFTCSKIPIKRNKIGPENQSEPIESFGWLD